MGPLRICGMGAAAAVAARAAEAPSASVDTAAGALSAFRIEHGNLDADGTSGTSTRSEGADTKRRRLLKELAELPETIEGDGARRNVEVAELVPLLDAAQLRLAGWSSHAVG